MTFAFAAPLCLSLLVSPALRAPTTRIVPSVMQIGEDLYDKIEAKWRFLAGEAASQRISEAAAPLADEMVMQNQKDKVLFERDTRRWCLDRCLATGYCDVVEDLWDLSSEQVVKFCQACAGEDECVLDEETAYTYVGHLVNAASQPDVNVIFDAIDLDNDGVVTEAELKSHLRARGYADSAIDAIFARLDANQDGSISREELAAGFTGPQAASPMDKVDAAMPFKVPKGAKKL
jgi:hypothetical protein